MESTNDDLKAEVNNRLEQGPMEDYEIGATVTTLYGTGEVVEVRKNQDQLVVRLASGGTAYLNQNTVKKKKKLFEMNDQDKFAASSQHREEGNMFFKMGDYAVASQKYELAKVYLRQLDKIKHAEMLSLLNNIALTAIKMGRFADAVAACDDSLANYVTGSGESMNAAEVKCLYFRGQANRKRGDLESALADFVKAVKAAPKNKSVREEYESLVKDMKAAKEKEAQLFRKAFVKEQQQQEPPAIQESAADPVVSKPVEETESETRVEEKTSSPVTIEKEADGDNEDGGLLVTYGTTFAIAVAAAGMVLYMMNRRR